jgi:hypothetical protein
LWMVCPEGCDGGTVIVQAVGDGESRKTESFGDPARPTEDVADSHANTLHRFNDATNTSHSEDIPFWDNQQPSASLCE